jgi:hypothetical protein
LRKKVTTRDLEGLREQLAQALMAGSENLQMVSLRVEAALSLLMKMFPRFKDEFPVEVRRQGRAREIVTSLHSGTMSLPEMMAATREWNDDRENMPLSWKSFGMSLTGLVLKDAETPVDQIEGFLREINCPAQMAEHLITSLGKMREAPVEASPPTT